MKQLASRATGKEETPFGTTEMIDERFDSRILANMNAALDFVCGNALDGEAHVVRKRVAKQIIKCASDGNTTLVELIAAGERALIKVTDAKSHSA
jgi:altronate dehydratase